MATSSIFANIEIKDKKTARKFIKALEKASKQPKRVPTGEVPPLLTDHDEIRKLFEKGLSNK